MAWDYTAWETSPADLPQRLELLRTGGWAGFSLTMPLKAAAAGLVDALDPLAARLGVINTAVPSGQTVVGYNTDVAGIVAAIASLTPATSLEPATSPEPATPLELATSPEPAATPDRAAGPLAAERLTSDRAAVLGAGGTAVAAVAALAEVGVTSLLVAVRNVERAGPMVDVGQRCGVAVDVVGWPRTVAALGPVGLVVSTTPVGATDALATDTWPAGVGLVEVVYHPWPTVLAAAALAVGAPVAGGRSVLVGQAVGQVALMTGRAVDPAVLRAAL